MKGILDQLAGTRAAMWLHRLYRLAAAGVYCLGICCHSASAEGSLQSVLLKPQAEVAPLYDLEPARLSRSQLGEIRKHGLRNAPLDQRLWAVRYLDQLDNRFLVSIRPYYLRLSEDPAVRIHQVEIEFSFHPVSYEQMSLQPHSHTGILEIGFAGELKPGHPGRRLALNRGYAARLSSHFQFESGILFRSHHRSVVVSPAAEPVLHTGRRYLLLLNLSSSRVELLLDGLAFAHVSGQGLDRGLLSLTVGWHPVVIQRLKVRGSRQVNNTTVPFEVSGLYFLE